MENAPREPQLEENLGKLIMKNNVLYNRRVEELPTLLTNRSSLIILDECDKRIKPFNTQKWNSHHWEKASKNTKNM